jgi:hypothetical protein
MGITANRKLVKFGVNQKLESLANRKLASLAQIENL